MQPQHAPRARRRINVAAVAWVAGSVALSIAIVVIAHLWDAKPRVDDAAFSMAGPMFAVYVTGCLIAGGVRRPIILIPMFLFGATFTFWGILIGMPLFFVGGSLGVPQAVITALVFHPATRSWIPGVGSVVGIALGWTLAITSSDVVRWGLVIFPWHACVVISLIWWIAAKRGFEAQPPPGFCPACGYNLVGLALGAVCPECGAMPRVSS